MKIVYTTLIISIFTMISGCGSITLKRDGNELVTQLNFSERYDASSEFHQVSMMVGKDYIWYANRSVPMERLVFDMNSRVIYLINRYEKKIRSISVAGAENRSSQLEITYQQGEGKPGTKYYKYTVDGESCYNAVIAEEFVLKDNLSLLAAFDQAKSQVPGMHQFEDLCGKALLLENPAKRLENGFPVREWTSAGYTRFLDTVTTNVPIPEEMFEISKGMEIVDQ